MDVVDGAVALRPLTFGVGRGRILVEASLTPQVEGDAVRARAEVRFERLDVSRLMEASGGYQGEGVLSGAARLEGTGRSVAEILPFLNTYRTMCIAPEPEFRRLLEGIRNMRLPA